MMRLSKLIVAGLAVFSFASAANAVEISIDTPVVSINAGETFTIDIRLENADASAVTGIAGIVSGLNAIGGTVVSGQTSLLNFASICADFGGGLTCFGAINTLTNANFDPTDLSAAGLGGVGAYTPGDDFVNIIAALHGPGTSSNGTGAADPGVAGVLGSHDPIDITLTIMALTAGTIDIDVIVDFTTTTGAGSATGTVNVTVVPEPGTALLMGLGLAGLGVAGRRS